MSGRSWFMGGGVGLLAMGLLATIGVPVGVAATTADAVTTRTGAYFGAYIQPRTGWTRADQEASINNIESYLGRKLDIDHVFHPWAGAAFPGWRQVWDLQNGRIPMISWSGTYLSDVLGGSFDSMIRERADGLRGLGGRVLLRWFGEMDASINDDEIQSPAQFVTAWRYVHDIFVSRGATNVEWVWCPNSFAFGTGEAQQLYPGDDYVDWICADGYNWAPARPNSPWRSFKDTFVPFYAWAASKPQPLMVGETGVMENAPGDKAAWILDMGNTIRTVYPEIKALVYFDAYSTANFGGWYDWRVDTSTSSYQAYRTVANDPYFKGGAPAPEPTPVPNTTPAPDAQPPTVPSGLQAVTSGARVDLHWMASTDNVGVQGYDILRDGTLLTTVSSTMYSDPSVSPGGTYSYEVRARDQAGNESLMSYPVSVTTPAGSPGLFADGFEAGSMSAWTSATRMIVREGFGHSGSFAVEASANGTNGSFANKSFPGTLTELYARTWFNVTSQSSVTNLLRFQSSVGSNIATLFVSRGGDLMVRNDVRATNLWSPSKVTNGVWHQVQIRLKVGTSGLVEVWYDGQRIARLSVTQNLGAAPVGRMLLGDNVSGRTYRVLFDDTAASVAPIA